MMKKVMIMALICCLGFMYGCSDSPQEPDKPDVPPDGPQNQTEEVHDPVTEADLADTYWVAREYIATEIENRPDTVYEMPHEGWNVDLILYKEGAARLRSVKDYAYVEETAVFADASWTVGTDGKTLILSEYAGGSGETLTGWMQEGKLYLSDGTGTFIMEKGSMPVNGAEWLPADMVGIWKLSTNEIEGYVETAEELGIEGYLSFSAYDGGLAADYYTSDDSGILTEVFADQVKYEEMSLHEGCANEVWSVSFTSEDGLTECYATIIDRDTLRMMIFTYLDGMEYPAVAVQNFLWQGNGSGAVG
ncbi:MAG: hypothetical protein IKM19_06460 [Firmicutes bacterium]|nr:hypothetical protein [Bacillota bacterium]